MNNPLFYSESFFKAYEKSVNECERHHVEYLFSEHLLYNCFLMAETSEKIVSHYSIDILNKIKQDLKIYLDETMILFNVVSDEKKWINSAINQAPEMVGEYELVQDQLVDEQAPPVVIRTPMLDIIHSRAAKHNSTPQSPLISIESFFSQIMETETEGANILKKYNIDPKIFEEVDREKQEDNSKLSAQIHKFCENLYQAVTKSKVKYVYRQKELNKLAEIFSRKERNNALILGDPGVGKSALVEQMILMMEQRQFHPQLNKAQVLVLDIGALISGTKYRGEFEERMELLVKEFLSCKKNIILLLEDVHVIVGSGSSSGMDMAHFIKPLLKSSHIRVVGTSSQQDWRAIIESQNGLNRYFENISLSGMSIEDTTAILKERSEEFSSHHKLSYSENVLQKAAELSSKFLIKKPQPSAALDLVDRVGAKVARNVLTKKAEPKVSEQDLIETIAELANLSALKIAQSDNEKILLLKNKLEQEVIGQDEAMDKLFQSIVIAKSGLREENKTLSSFLFIGKTGVGKTEAAKTIAFELEIPLLRFDMSEYSESHTISKLIGAPPGYIGYGKGGALSEAIEENPYSVVLIDELEKASPEIYNLFLQIMDNGFFRDAQNRLINCQHTLFIMTSNLGAKEAAKSNVGLQVSSQISKQKEVVNNSLRPEFLNRFDAIVYFKDLGSEELKKILTKQLEKLNSSLTKHRVIIKISNAAADYIVENTQKQDMGARPMKRIIEDKIKNPLALQILRGKLKQEIQVDLDKGELILN